VIEASPSNSRFSRELNLPMRAFSGAHAHRAVHTGPMRLEEHAHDWPCLVLHLLGRYREHNDAADLTIDGPAAILHAAGEAHQEHFATACAEVIILHFDPDWLALSAVEKTALSTKAWVEGAGAARARRLARTWLDAHRSEADLALATADFFRRGAEIDRTRPPWMDRVDALLDGEESQSATVVARRLGMNRAWLAHAYRQWTGEGLHERVVRRRVEAAISQLRTGDAPFADVALTSGFCDQSHMNRVLRRATGRTPARLRAEGRA
jgi:AraC family transcriptional regulator